MTNEKRKKKKKKSHLSFSAYARGRRGYLRILRLAQSRPINRTPTHLFHLGSDESVINIWARGQKLVTGL